MIITIGGMLGSGKSTIAKMLAKKLSYKHYSTGDFMRLIASDHNIDLLELSKIAEKEDWVDKELDMRQEKLGETEDDFIIDGRLAWHFIPQSLKIFFEVSEEEAAKRIWNDKDNRNEGFSSQEEIISKIQMRKDSEIKRYQQYYGINHYDMDNYDLVIDTTNLTPDEIIELILKKLNE